MRFLCCGDLHLGSSPDFGNEPGERLADQRRVWLALASAGVVHNVDAMLFAGDAYHRRRPTPSEIVAFKDGVELLKSEGIPLVAIAGNHDVSTTDAPTAPGVLDGFAEFFCHRSPRVVKVQPLASGPVEEVAVLPWVPSARWIAQNGRGDSFAFTEALLDTLRGMRASCQTPHPTLLLHWSVSGAETPTGARTDDFREPVLPAGELEGMDWGAIVCGHIHKVQGLGSDLTGSRAFFYTGSPLVVDFGEWRTEHGYWILETGVGAEFHELGVDRGFAAYDLDLREGNVAPGLLMDPGFWQPTHAGMIVRVRYRCSAEQATLIDPAAIRAALYKQGAHRVYQITPIVEREVRDQRPLDETAGPLDAVREWCAAKGVEDTDRLLERTAQYLGEVL